MTIKLRRAFDWKPIAERAFWPHILGPLFSTMTGGRAPGSGENFQFRGLRRVPTWGWKAQAFPLFMLICDYCCVSYTLDRCDGGVICLKY